MDKMMSKARIYFNTAITLLQLPFYYVSYKFAMLKFRQHQLAMSKSVQHTEMEPTFTFAH